MRGVFVDANESLAVIFDRLRKSGDPDVRVAILTGAGGHFSAGADLDRLVGALLSGKPTENEFEERIKEDFGLIFKGFLKEYRTKKPLIAAVEGYCYAGGTEILQATAIRGAGKGASPVFYTNMGSGVGGGLAIDGKLYHGAPPGEMELREFCSPVPT